MFESIAVSVLNSVLGKYIKDLDSTNLRLGILKGRAVLTDLELRDDALDGFHLPVEVICGYVGKISLLIPWANPFSEPYEITVHDVYLIAGPVRDRKYDPERARASEVEAKRKRLAQIVKRMHPTEASKTEEKPADEEDGSDSFVDKLAAQVVKNLKISVRNIHFRYEDKVTSPANPFAVGFTLQNLSAETTNEFWQEAVVNASAKTVYKIMSLDCLSVYWNTNQRPSSFYGGQKSWKRLMSQGVSSKASSPSDFEFILKPLSAECHVIMDQSSEMVLDTPKLLIEVLQQELSLMLSQNQFHNLVDMFESFELMAINQLFRKYQPTSPIKANPRAWWKYAYTAICEERIRSWTWARMKEHRIKYRLYKQLWIETLKGFGEDERERKLTTIQSLEDTLDIPSILIARKHAESQVPPKERFRSGHGHERPSSSWLSWFGFGSENSESSSYHEGAMHNVKEGKEDIWSMLSGASLTAEEKEKLYKAIDYDENVRVKYPVEYIKSRVTFNLDRCTFVLLDAKNKEIAQLDTEGFDARLEQRPGQSAFRFHGKINRFKMLGYSEDKENQLSLLSSKTSASEGTPLVDCVLETKPLQLSANYAVKLKVEPIEAHYDSTTIDKIVSFFSMPESSKLKELEMAAANSFQELQKKYLERMSKVDLLLEMELGVTGGEEDGVDNTDVDSSRLYTQPEEVWQVYETLSAVPNGKFTVAAAFGNVHGVYAPGNVSLKPVILHNTQKFIKEKLGTDDDKPVSFVFHGGSGSSLEDIRYAIEAGVIKMNIDTDTQWAFWDGMNEYQKKNKDYLQGQIGNPEGPEKPNKKYYDPFIALRSG